jgi:Na+-translocating ferredoxin:NAD+ oxidoreductase subunit C
MSRSFRGGVHPSDQKLHTAAKAIVLAPAPDKVIIPMRQHIGAPCDPTVAVGDVVKVGQIVGDTGAFVAAPVHASVSGKVTEITEKSHPVFGTAKAVVIENDGQDTWVDLQPCANWQALSPKEIKEAIRKAGVVGLGGAAFPTHVKLSPPPEKPIDAVILNGAECEPYLTADQRIMLEQGEKVLTGLRIVMQALGVVKGYIGIEENKPDAIKHLNSLLQNHSPIKIEVVPLACKYPQGAEKTLIKAILNREVPSGGLPMDVGVVVQNVGTVAAVAEAVIEGKPLVERVVTVTGLCIEEPKNVLLRIGTTFQHAVKAAGGFSCTPAKVIMGGPMMGMAQATLEVPVIKGTSGILTLTEAEIQVPPQSPCIRCGRCVDACPMGLNPSLLSILGERGIYDKAKAEYDLLDCVECGSCVYVCPAKRNIVHYVKLSKAQSAKK